VLEDFLKPMGLSQDRPGLSIGGGWATRAWLWSDRVRPEARSVVSSRPSRLRMGSV
jgi:hypothetical protein